MGITYGSFIYGPRLLKVVDKYSLYGRKFERYTLLHPRAKCLCTKSDNKHYWDLIIAI